ncbi:MAG TPA: N-acetyltransferase [Verrucomicrobiae bacterium]
MSLHIRPEKPQDIPEIHRLHVAAFGGPGEARLVDALRAADALTVSLVAEEGGAVIGHIAFSPLEIIVEDGTTRGLALAPVGILPAHQRRGIGSRLIKAGLDEARRLGWEIVIVLGHHDYYPRFGFVTAKPHGILCPFEVPDEAFMVLELQSGSMARHHGMVKYHAAFSAL